MATTRSFSTMLQEYLPNKLLKEELIKRNWLLQNVQRDDSWSGGKLIVPFKGSRASSVEFGQLAASSDIAEDSFVRGEISDYQEVWGSMIFNHRDLVDHEGKIPEATFLKLTAETVDDFMDYMNQVVSVALTTGPQFATALTDGQAGGTITVDKIDRFYLGQKVVLDDGNSAQANYYVIAIAVDSATVTVSATRGGAAADISAYTLAQSAKFYHPGVWNGSTASTFTSIRDALLSNANGGSASLHGQTKTAYPFLQAVNVSGSDVTVVNLLDKIFDAYTKIQAKAKGRASTVLMSLSNLGVIMKLIQIEKGPYHVSAGDKKAHEYGWQEISVGSTTGQGLKLVGIQEMDNDVIHFLDMKSMTFRSKGFFKKRKAPDGREYFEVRATSGYQYIVDLCLFGQLEVSKPGHNGVLHSISLSY